MGAYVTHAGSPGTDFSVNKPTLPPVGYTKIASVPARETRNQVAVQNQSTDTVLLVRSDGLGGNETLIVLSGAATAGAQGADWSSTTFKGQLDVYVPTANAGTDQVAIYVD